jgi:hypothetical protein
VAVPLRATKLQNRLAVAAFSTSAWCCAADRRGYKKKKGC